MENGMEGRKTGAKKCIMRLYSHALFKFRFFWSFFNCCYCWHWYFSKFFSLIWKLEVREKVKNLRKCYLFSSVNQYTPTGSIFWHAISKFQSETLTGEAALWGKSLRYATKSPFTVLKIQSFYQITLQACATSAEYITKRLSLYWALILFF